MDQTLRYAYTVPTDFSESPIQLLAAWKLQNRAVCAPLYSRVAFNSRGNGNSETSIFSVHLSCLHISELIAVTSNWIQCSLYIWSGLMQPEN